MKRVLLVVDDSKLERAVLDGFLKDEYSILEAEDGEQAIETVRHHCDELSAIILDSDMPSLDGFETLKRIKAQEAWAQIPIIMTTSLEDDGSREKAISMGADGFATKPFNGKLLLHAVQNVIRLKETAALVSSASKDKLTNILNVEAFYNEAERMISQHEAGYYILTCVNVNQFKLINDQYGIRKGDEVLIYIADCLSQISSQIQGLCCRYMADKFGILYPVSLVNSEIISQHHKTIMSPPCLNRPISISIGRYLVTDLSLPIRAMFDRASLAQESVKGNYGKYIGKYDDSMRLKLLSTQKIISSMEESLKDHQFKPWLQPQYNHTTGALIGAEALVRWEHDGQLVCPADFIPLFESNGFIYEMDRYIWKEVCKVLHRQLEEGKPALPISVNISRKDFFHDDFMECLVGLVKEFRLPVSLLRLEVTESAFAESSGLIMEKVNALIDYGFTVEIDDFGSGYSSLNTLKDVPAQILKLDMRFFDTRTNQARGGNIIESVVRMAKWIGMSVIAEGVEEKEQADYLKSIGCSYIQGFYYARPMPVEDYERLLVTQQGQRRLSTLKTVKNLDNNQFWNPKSMETLIFNSYVGGACIFECKGSSVELLRSNDQLEKELDPGLLDILLASPDLINASRSTFDSHEECSFDTRIAAPRPQYLRCTVRCIASCEDRFLIYCVVINTTEQHEAQLEAILASEKVNAIMNNSHSGITASIVRDGRKIRNLFVNTRFYNMLGYTKEQYASEVKELFDLIHPDDRQAVIQAVGELSSIGQAATVQMRVYRRDGKLIWLKDDISIVKLANYDEPVRLSDFMDITEQKEAEIREMESSRQLKIIMDNVNGGVSAIQIDDQGHSKSIFHNERYFNLYGLTMQQAADENLDVLKLIVPEDLPTVLEKSRKLKSDRQSTVIDYRIKKPNGKIALLRANSSIMSIPGYGDDVIASVITDITEKRSMESQLEAIVNNIYGGVSASVMQDGEPRFIVVNDRFFEMLGTTREQFKAKKMDKYSFLHPDDRERIVRQFETNDGGKSSYNMEYRIIRTDGQLRYIRNNVSIIHLYGVDEPVQLSVLNDMTDVHVSRLKELEVKDRLQAVMDVMSSGLTAVAIHDEHTEFLFANTQYYRMHGIQESQLGKSDLSSALSLVHPDDRQKVRDAVMNAGKPAHPDSVTYRIIMPDKTIRWCKATIKVTHLAGIDVPVQVTVFSDITEALKSSDQLQFLNEAAHDIIQTTDNDQAISKTLDRLLRYFDGDRAFVIEMNNDSTLSNTYERCATGIESKMSTLQNVPLSIAEYWFDEYRQGKFIAIDDVSRLGDDNEGLRTLLQHMGIRSLITAPLFRESQLIGFIGLDNPGKAAQQIERLKAVADYIAMIITRRDLGRKIYQDALQMQMLVNDTPGGFMRMEILEGSHAVIVNLNDGICKILGGSSQAIMEAYGDDALKGICKEDMDRVFSDARKAYEEEGQVTDKLRLRRLDGSLIWTMFFARFTKAEDGRVFLNSYFSEISQALQAEQIQMQMLDNLPTGATLYEFDGSRLKVIHINKQYWKLVNRKPVDYSSRTILDVIHPDDQELVIQEIQSAIRQKRNASMIVRIICGDGQYRSFKAIASIFPKDNGSYLLYATYEMLSEDTMSVQQLLPIALSTMMSASGDISYVKDKDLRYLCCSQSMVPLTKMQSTRDIVGKTASELFSSKYASQFTVNDLKVLSTGQAIVDKLESLPSPQGTILVVLTSKYPILDTKGEVIGIYGTYRDITEQKQRESQLELLTSTIPGGLMAYSIGPEGIKALFFNDGCFNFSGYTREEYVNLISKDPLGLMAEEDRPRMNELLQSVVHAKNDGAVHSLVFRCKTKSGAIKWMSFKATSYNTDSDHAILNAVQLDITEQIEEKERLQHIKEEYRLASRHNGTTIGRYDIASQTLTIKENVAAKLDLPDIIPDVPYGRVRLGKISQSTAQAYIDFYERIARGEKECSVTFQKLLTTGWRWMTERATTLFDRDGKPVSAIITYVDVTDQMEKEGIFSKWQQSLKDRLDSSYTLIRCNISKIQALDSREGSLIDFITPDEPRSFDEIIQLYAEQGVLSEDRQVFIEFLQSESLILQYKLNHRSSTIEYRQLNGKWISLTVDLVQHPNSNEIQAYLMFEDIDYKKKAALETIRQAQTDPLTGVLNRSVFISRMNKAIKEAPEDQHALILLDIDNFKHLNDSQGHEAGDNMLKKLSSSISRLLGPKDLLGRLGGDEFFIFLSSVPGRQYVQDRAQLICDCQKNHVTLSLGIAMIPDDGKSFDELYHKVDSALYAQKANGKDGYMFV